jgi:hypothetical protein
MVPCTPNDTRIQAMRKPKPVNLRDRAMKAVKAAGGPIYVGEVFGISRQAVSSWQRVPAEYALRMEQLSGLTRFWMRPDVFGSQGRLIEVNDED